MSQLGNNSIQMEGVKMPKVTLAITFLLLISVSITAADEIIESKQAEAKYLPGIHYYNQMYGTVHLQKGSDAETVTTISCGQPLRVIEFEKEWGNVKVGPYTGFIKKEYISAKKTPCFQDDYPKFFNLLNLELSEIYHWGRLYDQYIIGKSRIK